MNTFQEYDNNPSEHPSSKLTGNSEGLLHTQILELSGDLNLETTAKLNVDLKTMPGLKLLSLNKDDAVKNPPTEVEKLGIKIEVEAGEGEG